MGRHHVIVAALCLLGVSTAVATPRLSVETTGHHTTWVPLDEAIMKHEELARFGTSDDDHAQRAELHASYTLVAPDRATTDGDMIRIAAYGNQVLHGDWVSTAATDSTHRVGVALDGTADLTTWLALEGRMTCASTRFVGNAAGGVTVMLAPRVISSAGVTAKRGDSFVSLRARGFTGRPDSEDGLLVADRIALVDVEAGMRRGAWDVTLTIENLMNTSWRETSLVAQGSGTPLTAKAFFSYAY